MSRKSKPSTDRRNIRESEKKRASTLDVAQQFSELQELRRQVRIALCGRKVEPIVTLMLSDAQGLGRYLNDARADAFAGTTTRNNGDRLSKSE